MGLQIIFVLETDEKSRSDYMYISSILDQWYDFRQNNDIKISKVFMRGKGNFRKKNIVNKIESFIKAYNNGDSYVVYCFDTDHFVMGCLTPLWSIFCQLKRLHNE